MGPQAEKRALALVVLGALGVAGACGPAEPPLCDEKSSLVDMEAWTEVPAADDPWEPAEDTPFCTIANGEIRSEPFGNGPVALDIDTNFECGWATVTQPAALPIEKGEHVLIRVFYFSQVTFPQATAQMAVRIGDDEIWSETVDIPTESNVTAPDIVMERDVDEGEPILFHIGNHGNNVWSLIELMRLRKVECADAGPAA
jgi:hypothetical protein